MNHFKLNIITWKESYTVAKFLPKETLEFITRKQISSLDLSEGTFQPSEIIFLSLGKH